MTDVTLENNGVRLAASVYGPAHGDPLLFLHGMSLSRDTWGEIALRLMDRYRVWTLDFRGHGHSDRAPTYELRDFLSDAETVLAAIGRPTIIVGHSLGGCVAGLLGQSGDPKVRAIFLEDPPWYCGELSEWEKTVFPKVFTLVSAAQAKWQGEKAPLTTYLDFLANSPTPMGGIGSDHYGPRHLLSHASALQRLDVRCWASFAGQACAQTLSAIPTALAFKSPALLIQADPRLGPAFLDGHEIRLKKTNPEMETVRYDGSGHTPHRSLAFEERYIRDLLTFVARISA